ncbi:GNAT family N-acetyltransferase [Kriegella aquimaris]|uniref:Ribosomal-protein-alanine N-acetyltransferase n=1 Tax=Kriegella aquimaris TaxID=192904 RepID=A0A1G9QQD9_9FLAO|nr:GNAT family N-acetyltransferase [Kriegella aquimaris]SDM13262.1 ribosomal-protein-alanine N-acetyltransferase [Kriegella aquimaris]
MNSAGKLTIHELVLDDAADLCHLMVSNMARFERFFPNTLRQNLTVKTSQDFIRKKQTQFKTNFEFTWLLKEAVSSKLIGLIILKELNWIDGVGELAYCIDKNFNGKGWMTQAVKIISKHAFEQLKLGSLQIVVHKENTGSIRVAEKCGYIWKRTLSEAYTPPKESALDMELYELN